jgi:hypothetical protein
MLRQPSASSPGTPGEGWGGGLNKVASLAPNPHPNPPPEYREREQRGVATSADGAHHHAVHPPSMIRFCPVM